MCKKVVGLTAIAAFIIAPTSLRAQACVGSHAAHGQGQFGVGVGFTDGATAYGLSGGGFTQGPMFVSGGFTRIDFDNSDVGANQVDATLGAELSTSSPLSLCPAATFGYTWYDGIPDGADLNGIVLGAGLGIGQTFGDELLFTPYGSAAVAYSRATGSYGGVSQTDSETYGQFSAGFSVGSNQVFAGPSISISTLDNSDPIFGINAAIVF